MRVEISLMLLLATGCGFIEKKTGTEKERNPIETKTPEVSSDQTRETEKEHKSLETNNTAVTPDQINDLSIFKSVKILGEIYVAEDENGHLAPYLTASHKYTNTLECSTSTTLKVFRDDDPQAIDITITNILVYPSLGPDNTRIPVHVDLKDGEKIEKEQRASVTLMCSGYNHSEPVPTEVCEAPHRLQGHRETCDLFISLYGTGQYPLIIEGHYIGKCKC